MKRRPRESVWSAFSISPILERALLAARPEDRLLHPQVDSCSSFEPDLPEWCIRQVWDHLTADERSAVERTIAGARHDPTDLERGVPRRRDGFRLAALIADQTLNDLEEDARRSRSNSPRCAATCVAILYSRGASGERVREFCQELEQKLLLEDLRGALLLDEAFLRELSTVRRVLANGGTTEDGYSTT